MDKFAAQSILIGILPIGAILGVFITKIMLIYTRRLTGIYVFAVINVGAIVLVNMTSFGTLVAGRFIEGICIGYYTTIAPIYLKEIAPKELRKLLGLFFSLGKIIGVLVVIILELIFHALHV
jgi:SP family galactose:H+ symporter-like MFS transporter